jgi:hypothetical protein
MELPRATALTSLLWGTPGPSSGRHSRGGGCLLPHDLTGAAQSVSRATSLTAEVHFPQRRARRPMCMRPRAERGSDQPKSPRCTVCGDWPPRLRARMRKWITGIPLREEVYEECLWAFWASPLGAGALICQPGAVPQANTHTCRCLRQSAETSTVGGAIGTVSQGRVHRMWSLAHGSTASDA